MIDVIGPSNPEPKIIAIRKDLCKELGEELGKSIYKQLTVNEKYLKENLNYHENKALIEFMYAKIYEQLYEEEYKK